MIILTPNQNEIKDTDTLNTLTRKELQKQGIAHKITVDYYFNTIYMINGTEYRISYNSTFARIELISKEEYNKTEIEINTNNHRQVKAHFTPYNEIEISHINENGQTDKKYTITQGDFITMLNWYNYQKENGNTDLMF